MDTINCPFGTFGNLASKSCNNTCNSGYENYLEHSELIFIFFNLLKGCSSYCTTGTSAYTDGGN